MDKYQTAVIVGVGPGLGSALSRKFAKEGYTVFLISRTPKNLEKIKGVIEEEGGSAVALPCDVTDAKQVETAFKHIVETFGNINILVYNAGDFETQSIIDIEPENFKSSWETNCFGAFLCAKQAIPSMLELSRGTIIFTGATASMRGSAGFARLAVGKFGLRALAQSMARELGPEGIHVAHVIIDGQIASKENNQSQPDREPGSFLSPEAISEQYWQIHIQDKTSWTLELDLRPSVEKF
ncbi:MAG: SDR family NAD(P)-dependent oxidoreductase [Deltaproteobacteria bacterium]